MEEVIETNLVTFTVFFVNALPFVKLKFMLDILQIAALESLDVADVLIFDDM